MKQIYVYGQINSTLLLLEYVTAGLLTLHRHSPAFLKWTFSIFSENHSSIQFYMLILKPTYIY